MRAAKSAEAARVIESKFEKYLEAAKEFAGLLDALAVEFVVESKEFKTLSMAFDMMDAHRFAIGGFDYELPEILESFEKGINRERMDA